MKKSAKVKLIIAITIIILLFVLSVIVNIRDSQKNKKQDAVKNETENVGSYVQESPANLYADTSIKEIETMPLLLATQSAINTYYSYINSNNSEAILSVLDKEYIGSKGITKNNVISKLNVSSSNVKFFATKVYSKEISFDHEYKYWVLGKTYTQNTGCKTEQFIVNLDLFNETFKITPVGASSEGEFESYIEKIKRNDDGEVKIADGKITSIDENMYNKISIYNGNEAIKKTIENYAEYYYIMEITNPQDAYNLLDEEYRAAKFKNFDEYKKSKLMWKSVDIQYVRKNNEGNKVRYIGIDKKGTYYIFEESSPMNYTVMLDSYTTPLEETTKKYDEAKDMEKACMCIKNIEEMINNKDYKTMYSLMNSVFKQEKFKTQASFEEYIKNNYYENCKFSFDIYTTSEENFIVWVKVSNINNEEQTFEVKYVVKLGESITDFEYSFSEQI